ncbi:hypothetical protein ACYOEI_19060 [Singulisphaera rosea]
MLATIMSVCSGGDPGYFPDMGSVVGGGAWLVPRYYRFWARRRHPGLWGVTFGGLAGCLLLGGLIISLVLPGEATTVRTLEESRRRIETYYKKQGHYPEPDGQRRLTQGAFGVGQGLRDEVIRDGFGRPLLYRVSGRGRLASYFVKSLGFDGRQGRDDLCIAGQTRLMRLADVAANIARRAVPRRGTIEEAVLNELKGIHSLGCKE